MTNLSVNINKIALLRNSRPGNNPSPLEFAEKCLENGANGITVHPRPDLRHIKPSDLADIKKITQEYDVEFNIEGNPLEQENNHYPGFSKLIENNKPDQVTLVPDDSNQLTSDHGWDLKATSTELKELSDSYKNQNIRTSIFLDPIKEQLQLAKEINIDRVELYTGPFAKAFENQDAKTLEIYEEAILFANEIDLKLNAGHDLNLSNLATLISYGIIEEVSIGHALIVECLDLGLEETIKRYLKILK
mgnify:FL=1